MNRYWPDKAPEWADKEIEDASGDIRSDREAAFDKAFPHHEEDTAIVRKDDRRLRRLIESRVDNLEEVRADHRRIRQAVIVSTIEEEAKRQEGLDLEEQDEDARRRRIKEKLRQRDQEEALPQEEEEYTGVAMVKPVFVPKTERDTIAERERLEAEEEALEEARKRRMEERRNETRQVVVEEIRKDQEIQKNIELEANIADVDTDDELNEAEEY